MARMITGPAPARLGVLCFALFAVLVVAQPHAGASSQRPLVDEGMVQKLRTEGLERSRVMETLSYITDVLGARLTLSNDMARAQDWALDHMRSLDLGNVVAQPFMDYGIRWDNEYTSLHLMTPDYQPMVGYPISHTPGTNGKHTAPVVIGEIRSRADLGRLRGTLRGALVLATAPAVVDQEVYRRGVPRYTSADLALLAQPAPPPAAPPAAPAAAAAPPASAAAAAPNAAVVRPEEKMAFYKAEGVIAVFQSESGWPGAVRGFARPGTRADNWGRDESLAAPPIVAITPEHYNRMYRLRQRDIPVTVEIEIRNRIGESREQARNVFGEIPGTDLRDEVVMIGAHFDTGTRVRTPATTRPVWQWCSRPCACCVWRGPRLAGRFARRFGRGRSRACTDPGSMC